MRLDRHPQFDDVFQKHKGLIFKRAKILACQFGFHYRELVSYITLKLNECLFHFKKEKGYAFSTYFVNALTLSFKTHFLQHESEAKKLEFYNSKTTFTKKTIREADGFLAENTEENSQHEFWDMLKKILDKNQYYIVYNKYFNNIPLRKIALSLKIGAKQVTLLHSQALSIIEEKINSFNHD